MERTKAKWVLLVVLCCCWRMRSKGERGETWVCLTGFNLVLAGFLLFVGWKRKEDKGASGGALEWMEIYT